LSRLTLMACFFAIALRLLVEVRDLRVVTCGEGTQPSLER
jgi:hypothetical protein